MSKSDTWEQNLLDHLFLNSSVTLIGDATGLPAAATVGSLYVSLHTSDPGEAGDQTTNETSYTGYARIAVARSGSGWSRSGSTISNVAAVTFGLCTAGSATITHVGVGASSSGSGKLLYSAALSASLAVSNGITPSFAIGQLTVAED